LLGELFSRMKPQEWIVLYEKQFRNSNAVWLVDFELIWQKNRI
jgi:hypothetical protein